MQNILYKPQTNLLRDALLVLTGTAIIAVSAKIALPVQPVNMTLQTFAVLLVGMVYGWRLGVATIIAYLAEGLMGIPVFAGAQAGVAPFLSATGGYLVGFIPAAGIAGFLVEKGWGQYRTTTVLAGLIATIVLYLFGLAPLVALFGWQQALTVGLYPFLGIATAKLLALAVIVPLFWKKQS